jgi:hypothetical protein
LLPTGRILGGKRFYLSEAVGSAVGPWYKLLGKHIDTKERAVASALGTLLASAQDTPYCAQRPRGRSLSAWARCVLKLRVQFRCSLEKQQCISVLRIAVELLNKLSAQLIQACSTVVIAIYTLHGK